MPEKSAQQLASEIESLRLSISTLERALSNMSREQDKVKSLLHFQSFSANPSRCSIGDVAVVAGTLKICTSANTWTVVGTQT